jgi:hypothetical protein
LPAKAMGHRIRIVSTQFFHNLVFFIVRTTIAMMFMTFET